MNHLKDQTGVAFILELVLVAVVLIGVGVGIYSATRHKPALATTVTAPSQSKSPAPTPSPRIVPAESGPVHWITYKSTTEPLSFQYPSNWTEQANGTTVASDTDGIKLKSPSGSAVVWSSFVSGLGGGCPPDGSKDLYISRVDAIPAATGLYVEEISSSSTSPVIRLGVIDAADTDTRKPPVVGLTDCLSYTTFQSHGRTYANVPVDMWLQTNGTIVQSDIPTIRQIMTSLTY